MESIVKNKRGIEVIGAVILLVVFLALVIIFILPASAGPIKGILGGLAGLGSESNELCEPYQKIVSEQNLTDLIVLVAAGKCGGNTTETAFRFNISAPYLKLDTEHKFCGTYTYEVKGSAYHGNYSITFGDVERENVENCGFNGDSLEYQECGRSGSEDKEDLIIAAPDRWAVDDCDTGINIWCYNQAPYTLNSHLHQFGLKGQLSESFGTWAIKRAGEDTVICLINAH